MGLIELLMILVIIGVILWLVEQIPMDASIKVIIRVVVILVVVLWLLSIFVGDINIPIHRVR